MKFIFITKTKWYEPPRIRHQLARLLVKHGNEVFFLEKNRPLIDIHRASGARRANWLEVEKSIYISSAIELVHHQLRLFNWMRRLDSFIQKRSIRKRLLELETLINLNEAVVVNFNHDAVFIRDVFPENKLITLINDDFVAQSRFYRGKKVARESLSKVLTFSDKVFTVSEELKKYLGAWCEPILFLPWADIDYQPPVKYSKRDSILIWCFFNRNIDYNLIWQVAHKYPDYTIRLVGPMDSKLRSHVTKVFSDKLNVTFEDPSSLSDLGVDNCFVSVIPYLNNIDYLKAVTASNKTFQLTARGIPIVTIGLPNFIVQEGIFVTHDRNEFIDRIAFCANNFYSLQNGLRYTTSINNSASRYNLFVNSLQDI